MRLRTVEAIWQEIDVPSWAETVAAYASYVIDTGEGRPEAGNLTFRIDSSPGGGGPILDRTYTSDLMRIRHDRREQAVALGHGGRRAVVHLSTAGSGWEWYLDDVEVVFACGVAVP